MRFSARFQPDSSRAGASRQGIIVGFNMLNDTFPELLSDGARIESPLIWESGRFAVDHKAGAPIGPEGVSRASAELGLATNEIGGQIGLTQTRKIPVRPE
jgi:N-acyl-L-homoserine lactone synthetase